MTWRAPLWQLSVTTWPQTEEAVTELLAARYEQSTTSYTDVETRQTTVTAYLKTKPDWSHAARRRLLKELRQIGRGSAGDSTKITLKILRPKDWTEEWKRHFKPLQIAGRLWVRPGWTRSQVRRGQTEIVLDPGLSFGTGQHATTHFCLAEVVRAYRPGRELSLLDIGTGSGILAIAAAKLGYKTVEAMDLDPEAVRIARSNAATNKLAGHIRFRCQDLATMRVSPSRTFSVVCANLMAELLLAHKDRILAAVQPHGLLVLAGILKTEFPGIQSAYEAWGMRLVRSRAQREWRSGTFRWGEVPGEP